MVYRRKAFSLMVTCHSTDMVFYQCRHEHPGDVQGVGPLFEYVSAPLSKDSLAYLRDLKLATDATVNDALSLRRSTRRPSGRSNPSQPTARTSTRGRTSGTTARAAYRLDIPPAPAQTTRAVGRRRSPSIEVVDTPSRAIFTVYVFHKVSFAALS